MIRDFLQRLKVSALADVGRDLDVRGRIWIHGRGKVRIGDRVRLDGSMVPIELHALSSDAELVIGDDVSIEGGTSIEADGAVTIGARCRIGAYCKIMDSHFHSLSDYGKRPAPVPLVVGNDVTLGARVVLLPGTQLDAGCVIYTGTVVTRRVGAGAALQGCPARPPSSAPPVATGQTRAQG